MKYLLALLLACVATSAVALSPPKDGHHNEVNGVVVEVRANDPGLWDLVPEIVEEKVTDFRDPNIGDFQTSVNGSTWGPMLDGMTQTCITYPVPNGNWNGFPSGTPWGAPNGRLDGTPASPLRITESLGGYNQHGVFQYNWRAAGGRTSMSFRGCGAGRLDPTGKSGWGDNAWSFKFAQPVMAFSMIVHSCNLHGDNDARIHINGWHDTGEGVEMVMHQDILKKPVDEYDCGGFRVSLSGSVPLDAVTMWLENSGGFGVSRMAEGSLANPPEPPPPEPPPPALTLEERVERLERFHEGE